MAKFEAGGDAAKTPHASPHDISTQLITLLSGLGVTSEHGLDHLFSTVDHLVDAALTHWGPEEEEGHGHGGEHQHGSGGAGAGAGGHPPHGEPHPAPVPGHEGAAGAAAHPGHPEVVGVAVGHGQDAHTADHGQQQQQQHETPKAGHHKPDASGFVM